MQVIFQLPVSAAVYFMVALGEKSKSLPCAAKKKRTQALYDLYLAPVVAVCSTVLQGKLAPGYSRRYLPSARQGWAQEAGSSYLVFSENRCPSELCCCAMK